MKSSETDIISAREMEKQMVRTVTKMLIMLQAESFASSFDLESIFGILIDRRNLQHSK